MIINHPEIDENFEKSMSDGIEDESLLDSSNDPHFTINSYGADYTVDSLVKRMRTRAFVIPEFQRNFIWTQRHASRFIESLLMGLPVPGIFLYKQSNNNTHLVIDGQQRLVSLRAFYDGNFGEKKFRLIGVREPWLEKTYNELDLSDQLKLDDSIVHATIFQQDKPQDVLNSIYFVFERINTGGISLSPQEIRNCIIQGSLLNAIRVLNKLREWREIFGNENSRLKDEELILRFFALYKQHSEYRRPMARFLNEYAEKNANLPEKSIDELVGIFSSVIKVIYKSIGIKAFRLARALNAAVFDSVMVGVARRLAPDSPQPSEEKIISAYQDLLKNQDYRRSCERSTADEEHVARRIQLATDAFART